MSASLISRVLASRFHLGKHLTLHTCWAAAGRVKYDVRRYKQTSANKPQIKLKIQWPSAEIKEKSFANEASTKSYELLDVNDKKRC